MGKWNSTTQGRFAEALVADRLRACGWDILLRNHRRRGSELDIVALRSRTLVIVEVKFRKKLVTTPEEAITKRQRLCLASGVRGFLAEFDCWRGNWDTIRIDLVVVYGSSAGLPQCYKAHRVKNVFEIEDV